MSLIYPVLTKHYDDTDEIMEDEMGWIHKTHGELEKRI
jgi:hypothetical protein